MAKMTLEDLRRLRGEKKNELAQRSAGGTAAQVLVGMGTCGIASGAKQTLDAFIAEIARRGLGSQVAVRQTACMGLCSHEPTVEISMPGMQAVMYGDVKAAVVPQVVESHIVNKTPLETLVMANRSGAV